MSRTSKSNINPSYKKTKYEEEFIMGAPNRFAIRDSGAATFYSLVNNKAIVTLNTLKTSGVETSGETVYARGGFGNAKLVGFSSNREAKISLEDAIFDAEAIAMITGNEMVVGKKTVDVNETKAVTSNKITLDKTPKGALISVYLVNPDGTNGDELTLGTPAKKFVHFIIFLYIFAVIIFY